VTSYRSGREPSPRVQECQRVDHVAQSQFRSHSLPSDANLVAVRTAYRPSMMPSPFYFQQIDVTRLKDCLGQFVQRVVLHRLDERPRYGHTATLLQNGTVLVSGGLSDNGAQVGAEIYDPNLGTWSPAGSMSVPRIRHTATLLPNGTVLIAGGHNINGAFINHLASADVHDPVSGTWSTRGSTSTARTHGIDVIIPAQRPIRIRSCEPSGRQLYVDDKRCDRF